MQPDDAKRTSTDNSTTNKSETFSPLDRKSLFAEWRDDYAAAKERDAHPGVDPLDSALRRARDSARDPGPGKHRSKDLGFEVG